MNEAIDICTHYIELYLDRTRSALQCSEQESWFSCELNDCQINSLVVILYSLSLSVCLSLCGSVPSLSYRMTLSLVLDVRPGQWSINWHNIPLYGNDCVCVSLRVCMYKSEEESSVSTTVHATHRVRPKVQNWSICIDLAQTVSPSLSLHSAARLVSICGGFDSLWIITAFISTAVAALLWSCTDKLNHCIF